jgi:hypothetical protein
MAPPSDAVASAFLTSARSRFAQYKKLAEDALAQVDNDAFFAALSEETDPLAILVKHVGGNLRSRWRDFLTTDGDKPDRQRDTEFELSPGDTRASLIEGWDTGWRLCLDEVNTLTEADLGRSVTIRGESLTVVDAIHRSLAHTAYHVGQIVLLAKHHAGPRWRSLSIPRGQSEQYSQQMRQRG